MTMLPMTPVPLMSDAGDSETGYDHRRLSRRGGIVGVRSLAIVGFCLGLALCGYLANDFMRYADEVTEMSAPAGLKADGIVVLTGGSERVKGAVDLLEAGRGSRLLISGVHPDTRAKQIGQITNASKSLFDCCIDLDRKAANTIGNARQTAKWAASNRFSSLLVVTSAYHIPRSMLELASAMPHMRLIPYPVSPVGDDLKSWYMKPGTWRLLVVEYAKYLATKARLALG